MLHALREQPFTFDADLFTVAIESRDRDLLETHDVADHPDDRQAALGHLFFIFRKHDLRIDDHRRFVFVVVHVHDEQPLRNADLRRGEADARSGIHGFEHVVDELLEERIVDFFQFDFFGNPAQRRVPVLDDFTDIGHGRDYSTQKRGPASLVR